MRRFLGVFAVAAVFCGAFGPASVASAMVIGFKLEGFQASSYNPSFVYEVGTTVNGIPGDNLQGFDIVEVSGTTAGVLQGAVTIDVLAVKNGVITEVDGAIEEELIKGTLNIDFGAPLSSISGSFKTGDGEDPLGGFTNVSGTLYSVMFDTRDLGTSALSHIAVSATVVPIPGAAWLFGSGVLGLLGIGYSRRRQAAV